jgi:hypothetical protein
MTFFCCMELYKKSLFFKFVIFLKNILFGLMAQPRRLRWQVEISDYQSQPLFCSWNQTRKRKPDKSQISKNYRSFFPPECRESLCPELILDHLSVSTCSCASHWAQLITRSWIYNLPLLLLLLPAFLCVWTPGVSEYTRTT